MEILPGVELVGGDEPHRCNANSYLIGDTLFDCGSFEGLIDLRLQLGDRRPARVIGTHAHRDHVQAAGWLEAQLWLPEPAWRPVFTRCPFRTASFLYDQPFRRLSPHRLLCDRQRLDLEFGTVTVLATPGHSPCSTSYLIERAGDRILVAGDALWGGYHSWIGSDLGVWRGSLEMLAGLEFDYVLPGHCDRGHLPQTRGDLLRGMADFGVELRPGFSAMLTPWS